MKKLILLFVILVSLVSCSTYNHNVSVKRINGMYDYKVAKEQHTTNDQHRIDSLNCVRKMKLDKVDKRYNKK